MAQGLTRETRSRYDFVITVVPFWGPYAKDCSIMSGEGVERRIHTAQR